MDILLGLVVGSCCCVLLLGLVVGSCCQYIVGMYMVVVNIRSDFIFSYWIFYWFLLYLVGVVPIAPTLWIYLGLAGNILETVYLITTRAPPYNVIKFITINIILKCIPLWFVYELPITATEIKISILVFIVYLVWIQINGKNPTEIYQEILRTYKGEKGQKTTMSTWYDRVFDMIF